MGSGFTDVFDLSRGTFVLLRRANASVVGYSREGMTSSIIGIGIDGETGLGIRKEVTSEMLFEREQVRLYRLLGSSGWSECELEEVFE